MRALLLLLTLLAALALVPSPAVEEGSVLVTTIMPRKGSLPDIVTAYGTAGPAVDGSMTISLQSQGRVLRFDVMPGEAVKAGQPLLKFGVSRVGARQLSPGGDRIADREGRALPYCPTPQAAVRDQGSADPGRQGDCRRADNTRYSEEIGL